jgi:hypothetical protein
MISASLLSPAELHCLTSLLFSTKRHQSFDALLREFQAAFHAPRPDDAPGDEEQPQRDVLFNALCSILILLEVSASIASFSI